MGGTREFTLWFHWVGEDYSANKLAEIDLVQILSGHGNLSYRVSEGSETEIEQLRYGGPPVSYVIPITAGELTGVDGTTHPGRWYRSDGGEATTDDIIRSFASLQGLYINAEFGEGYEHTALDKVSLNTPDRR